MISAHPIPDARVERAALWAESATLEATLWYEARWDGTAWVLHRDGDPVREDEWSLIFRDWTDTDRVWATTGRHNSNPHLLDFDRGVLCARMAAPRTEPASPVMLREYSRPPFSQLRHRADEIARAKLEADLCSGCATPNVRRIGRALLGVISGGNVDIAVRSARPSAGFREQFHSALGAGPNDYLRLLRLDAASALLVEFPDITVREICHLVGYRSHSGFCRSFRRVYGAAPGEWRQNALEAAFGVERRQ